MPDKYALISTDDTLHLLFDDLSPLLQEAKELVKSGDYKVSELAIYQLRYTFDISEPPPMVTKEVKW
jgi:hypothetical protein